MKILEQKSEHKEKIVTELEKNIENNGIIDIAVICIDNSFYEIRIKFFDLIDLNELLAIHTSFIKLVEEKGYKVSGSRIESPSIIELVYDLKGETK